MSRLVRSLAAVSILGALFGCGGLANPDGSIATVSGNLKGTAPNGSHVAIVWRSPKGEFVVTNDTAVVNGTFAFDLEGPPDDSLFSLMDTSRNSTVSDPTVGNNSGAPTSGSGGAAPSGTSGAASYGLQLLDTVSGTVSSPLSFAVAGFVVYEDKNGNGKLDLTGSNADSPDKIVGGSSELVLTYLRDGSDLELEKLRDSAGQKPTRGYQLAWIPKGRWLPLTGVDLTIGVDTLPSDVCYGGSGGSSSAGSPNGSTLDVSGSSDGGVGTEPVDAGPANIDGGVDVDGGASGGGTGGYSGYPSSSDPNLRCSADGRSFTYACIYDAGTGGGTIDAGPPSTSRGLCGASYGDATPPSSGVAEICYPGASLGPNDPIPSGWPCTVAKPLVDAGDSDGGLPAMDAGSAPDSGK